MGVSINMGRDNKGAEVEVDLEELLATRLLVQGNSGSGKSHLLRRLLEGSAEFVQQVIVDPEGDFVSLGEAFGHVEIDAGAYSLAEIMRMAMRVREHRASVVLNLEGLELEAQMRCAAAFTGALFDAPRDFWYPALVVVDEAQVFAPAVAGEVSDEARRASLGAMTNLMCRGRKRGLAGVIATQRLAKLAKNVAAEASNFMMGRTFLDIDMLRAADLLGMERRQAEVIRDLERGEFLSLGPAVSRRAIRVRIGSVRTAARSASPTLLPLPEQPAAEALSELLFAPAGEDDPLPAVPEPPARPAADEVIARLNPPAPPARAIPEAPDLDASEQAEAVAAALAGIAGEAASALRPAAELYQDFLIRCRMSGLAQAPLDLAEFRRRLLMARAGVANDDEDWEEALSLATLLPEEMLGAFLLIARAAREGAECPADSALAEVYGTSSLGRVRRMIDYMEAQGVIVARIDLAGKRSVSLPRLGWTTAAAFPDPEQPSRLARPARRR